MCPLLTPKQVAALLQISTRTVYDNARKLGGFYPAGIRVLRFRREDINAIMQNPPGGLEVGVSTQEETVPAGGPQGMDGGQRTGKWLEDQKRLDPNRHGL